MTKLGIKTAVLLLVCITAATAKEYRGAEYRTKQTFRYGRFEVRMQSAQREGMLSSFFTYNDNYPATPWNEIDIEILGRYSDDVQFNPITPGTVNHEVHYQTPFNPSQAFHVYAFEWTPTTVAWFVDGKEVHRQTGDHILALAHPQKIMMNVWNPGYPTWVGEWNPKVLPAFALYDWVSYSSYQPDSGDVGTNNDFKFQWKDEFNTFDTSRWAKASHTWNGNQCDMYPDNVVFKDGVMILCLTTNTTSGYYDGTEPWVEYARAEFGKINVHYSEEVDAVSAETVSNYILSGTSVTSATLLPDSQTVQLQLSVYDTSSFTNLIVVNTKDRFVPPNSLIVRNLMINKQKPLPLPLKINCGGPAYADYVADQEWSPTVEYGHRDGQSFTNSASIVGASDATIYHSAIKNPVEYLVRVPNGTYEVELQMAETVFSSVGNRIFSVAVENTLVVENLDLISVAGKNTAHQIVMKNVVVTDECLDIHFMAVVNYALMNGIIIRPVETSINGRWESRTPEWEVSQNYPNPFNGSTNIPVTTVEDDNLTLRVFDTLGRIVSEIPIGFVPKGSHQFSWQAGDLNGKPIASGPYYYAIEGSNFRSVKKMLLVQ